jgi:hypothetical protein
MFPRAASPANAGQGATMGAAAGASVEVCECAGKVMKVSLGEAE